MDKFDAIIVGGGLAGLSAAYCMAKDGLEVLVIERGDYSGAKNVTGGRLYINPVRALLPELWREAPLERFVGQETVTMMGEASSISIKLASDRFRRDPHHSFTIFRAKFDQWLADKASEAGAMVVTKQLVDDLVRENDKIAGIVSGEDKIMADVVVLANGAMSLLTEKAGLSKPHRPEEVALGIKEIIDLPETTINERFNLGDGEGAAQLFVGSLTKGMFGGGFLYTNRASLSLGMVVGISDLMEKQPPLEAADLIEDFKLRSEIAPLIKGGETVEYSAHIIGEGGLKTMPTLFDNGILVAGDAAGFTLNTGITVRGMEFAIASGVMVAKTVKQAKEKNDFSRTTLAYYERLLKDSFVLKDMETFRHAPEILTNHRIFQLYPEFACEAFEKLMYIGDGPKRKLSSTALSEVKTKLGWSWIKDIRQVFKI